MKKQYQAIEAVDVKGFRRVEAMEVVTLSPEAIAELGLADHFIEFAPPKTESKKKTQGDES